MKTYGNFDQPIACRVCGQRFENSPVGLGMLREHVWNLHAPSEDRLHSERLPARACRTATPRLIAPSYSARTNGALLQKWSIRARLPAGWRGGARRGWRLGEVELGRRNCGRFRRKRRVTARRAIA